MFVSIVFVALFGAWQKPVMAQTQSGPGTSSNEIVCKQIEGTLCMDNANTQGWLGSDFGERLTSAIQSLPTYHGYSRGTIWVKNDTYLMTSQVTITSPYVLIRCESGAVIDYQGIFRQ
jgi:hypothetical protein